MRATSPALPRTVGDIGAYSRPARGYTRGMGGADRPDLADTMAGWSGGGVETEILPRGSALGRYLVLEQRGAGGMGVVYSAYDPELDRKVAIKLVRHDPTAAGGSDGRARMLREAQAIARLSHPN